MSFRCVGPEWYSYNRKYICLDGGFYFASKFCNQSYTLHHFHSEVTAKKGTREKLRDVTKYTTAILAG